MKFYACEAQLAYLPLNRRQATVVLLLCSFLGLSSWAGAQSNSTNLEMIVVTGERPGPGLWRASKDGHDVWILATVAPLPTKMTWRIDTIQERLASSQVLIAPPQFTPQIGFFRALTLVPALLHARHNPDGETLAHVLPHDLYIRWLALRVRYLRRSDETMRPLIAALDLYSHALDKAGLAADDDEIWDSVQAIANHKHIPIERINITVPIDNPKGAVHDLNTISRDTEVECLAQTLDRLETGMQPMIARANMWSMGDVASLQALAIPGDLSACRDAFLSATQVQRQVLIVEQNLDDAWLLTVERAAFNNVSSFTLLPMDEVLKADGLLAKLRAKGFVVVAPQRTPQPGGLATDTHPSQASGIGDLR